MPLALEVNHPLYGAVENKPTSSCQAIKFMLPIHADPPVMHPTKPGLYRLNNDLN